MEYEGQICRGPMERSSYMLPISVGCSYNACHFCMLFKHLKYRELPLEQIEGELKRVKEAGGKPRRVFLGDGNAFCTDSPRLKSILRLVLEYFPDVEGINMDATVTGISQKSASDLAELRALRLDRLYLGIESGLDDVLKLMNKDHSLGQAYDQIERLSEHGIAYGAHIMTGVAGKGRGIENAEATAEFFNRTSPKAIINFSMFIHRSASLYRLVESGAFVPATELENLEEDRRLLKLLKTEGIDYDSFHDHLPFRVKGRLPDGRQKMLDKLDSEIEKQRGKPPVIAWSQ